MWSNTASFDAIVGKTVEEITVSDAKDLIEFSFKDGSVYRMFHEQDCCESVWIEEIVGNSLSDFVGETILFAEETSNSDDPPLEPGGDSWTWTFYKLASLRCNATIRWYGSSNGYYSESVSFVCVKE